jgi:cell division cycle 20-like protein 1 (cofactor of APC complex)
MQSKKNSVSHSIEDREKSSSWLAADRFIPQRRDSNLSDYNRINLKEILDLSESSSDEEKNGKSKQLSKILKDNFAQFNSTNPSTLFDFKPKEISQKSPKIDEDLVKKRRCKISQVPYKILEAPGFEDNYYHNILSWSNQDLLAISLANSIYILNNKTQETQKMYEAYNCEEISSLAFNPEGDKLAVGNVLGEVTIWDVNKSKDLNTLDAHQERVGSISWESYLLSGSKDKTIALQDPRMSLPKVSFFKAHSSEVCKVSWSPCNENFASGGNDNKMYVWSIKSQLPFFKASHEAGIRALSWSKNQFRVLYSGGGTGDGQLKAWNTNKKELMWNVKTGDQICSIETLKNTNDIITAGGFPSNCVTIWRARNGKKVCHLKGHSQRILEIALSPDFNSLVSGSADETLRFWKLPYKNEINLLTEFSQFSTGKSLR